VEALQHADLSRGALGRNAKIGGALGILSGILALLILLTPAPAGTTQQQLANFDARYWALIGIENLVGMLVVIAFAVYLRTVLVGRSPGTASAGAALLIAGIAIAGLLELILVSAMGSLAATYTSTTSSAAQKDAAVVLANVLKDLANSLIPLAFIGLGIALLSATMVNSRTFPNWLADIGFAQAVLVLIGAAVFPYLGLTSFAAFVVFILYGILLLAWIFGTSGYMLRAARVAPLGAPAAA
jgi:hypothetical protein